jgi:hypothetical protein
MRILIKLPSACPVADRDCLASFAVEVETENPRSLERDRDLEALRDHAGDAVAAKAARAAIVSIFLGGPHDEQVRRDIAAGEHIIEDPLTDPIGFYGLVRIDRGGGPRVQWYRWIETTGEHADWHDAS